MSPEEHEDEVLVEVRMGYRYWSDLGGWTDVHVLGHRGTILLPEYLPKGISESP